MNDRFKFRAGFTISFYDIAGNDVERQIILDSCFSIDNGGEGICVNEEIIQEALDIYVAKDEHKSAWDFINANYAETDGYYFIDSVDFLDQCTGLKDKNGKLIYEGDIIVKSDVSAIGYSRTRVCKVHWHNDWLSWAITTQYGDTYELSEFEPQQYEIIGNIHENADLLENEE